MTTNGFETLIFLEPLGKPKPCKGSSENPVITQVFNVLGSRRRIEVFPSELKKNKLEIKESFMTMGALSHPDEKLVKIQVSAMSSVR